MTHDHEYHHSHGHHQDHTHGPASFDRAFAIGTALNLGFVIVEAIYGYLAHSLALFADAGHNLGDVLGLVLVWGASALARVVLQKLVEDRKLLRKGINYATTPKIWLMKKTRSLTAAFATP